MDNSDKALIGGAALLGGIIVLARLKGAANPQPITLEASATPQEGDAPLTVNFSVMVHNGTAPYDFSWSFGDGQTSIYQNPSHTFQNSGTYAVICSVVDALSRAATVQIGIVVRSVADPVYVVGDRVLVSHNVTGNGPGEIIGIVWNPATSKYKYSVLLDTGSLVIVSIEKLTLI